MFDVGFSEIVLIAVLALIVLGPDKLPELGRKMGEFFRAFQQSKRDIQNSLLSTTEPKQKSTNNTQNDNTNHDTQSK